VKIAIVSRTRTCRGHPRRDSSASAAASSSCRYSCWRSVSISNLAVGTSLGALLPPVGILGAYEYYKHGHLNVTYALLLGLGLLIGAYIGAIYAVI